MSTGHYEKAGAARRALLKALAAGGAATAAGALPSRWLTPAVESVVLPAHAQATGELFGGSITLLLVEGRAPSPVLDLLAPRAWADVVQTQVTAELCIELLEGGTLAGVLGIVSETFLPGSNEHRVAGTVQVDGAFHDLIIVESACPDGSPVSIRIDSIGDTVSGHFTFGSFSSPFDFGPGSCPDRDLQCLNVSDRDLKQDFAAMDSDAVLERLAGLPVQSWRFRLAPATGRHIGPAAEDFRSSFGVGGEGRLCDAVDAAGVAFAAIQALHGRMREQDARLGELRTAIAALRARSGQ